MAVKDTQVGGDHYAAKSIQPWDAMESWFTPEEFRGYLRGNIIKYAARYREKGGVTDLRKLRQYADKLIEFEEAQARASPRGPFADMRRG